MYLASFTSPLADLLVRYAVLASAGLKTIGLLQAALGLGLALRTVLRTSFALLLTPALNRKIDKREKLKQAAVFLRILAALIGVLALPLVLMPHWWMILLYSRSFLVAAPSVYLFVLGISLQLFAAVNIALLVGVDDVSAFVWASVIGDSATGAFAWWMAPRMGLPGVALAFIADGIVLFLLSAWRLWSRHRLSVSVVGWMPVGVIGILALAGSVARQANAATLLEIGWKAGFWALISYALLRSVWKTRRFGRGRWPQNA
jgi:O-antigen/teichoic acid export membrane protein